MSRRRSERVHTERKQRKAAKRRQKQVKEKRAQGKRQTVRREGRKYQRKHPASPFFTRLVRQQKQGRR